MDFVNKVIFQKCLYFNRFLYKIWILVIGVLLAEKTATVDQLGELTTYLAVAVFALVVLLEGARIIIGQIGSIRNRVPELGGFLMITSFMQLPLLSFFLFNPYLNNEPVEIVLHGCLWFLALLEAVYGYIELKEASAFASSIYLAQHKEKDMSGSMDSEIKTTS